MTGAIAELILRIRTRFDGLDNFVTLFPRDSGYGSGGRIAEELVPVRLGGVFVTGGAEKVRIDVLVAHDQNRDASNTLRQRDFAISARDFEDVFPRVDRESLLWKERLVGFQ